MKKEDNSIGLSVVFITQPLCLTGVDWGFTQGETLASLIAVLREVSLLKRVYLSILVHPRENILDYLNYQLLSSPHLKVELVQGDKNFRKLMLADLVVGNISFLLSEAVIMGKVVIPVQLNLKEKDIVLSNRVGATIPVRKSEEMTTHLYRACVDFEYHSELRERNKFLQVEENSIEKWRTAILEILENGI